VHEELPTYPGSRRSKPCVPVEMLSLRKQNMAEIYNRTLVEAKAAMFLIPQSARVLAKNK